MASEVTPRKSGLNVGCLVAALISLLVIIAVVLLFWRSIWWEEDGAPVPRGTALEPSDLPPTIRPAQFPRV